MKAQRRHALQENTLARAIVNAPTFWQQSGGKMLLAAVAGLAIVLLVRYRISSSRAAASRAVDDLAIARSFIGQLENSGANPFAPALEQSNRRKQFYAEALDKLDEVDKLTDDRTLLSEAALARGDVNWTIANLPELPGAATQPELQIGELPQKLKDAADAYRTVVEKYPQQQHAAVAARFGLAAVSENLGEFDAAKTQYEQIAAMPNIPQAYLDLAKLRLQKLPDLRQPVLLAAATMPAPASAPARLPFGAAGPTLNRSATAAASPPGTVLAKIPLPGAGATTQPAPARAASAPAH